jgi:VIT1/CCC1 family predicted Fe2+/Mn2+ transporter
MIKTKDDYLRSAVFGCEDALVSTTGLVVGISAGIQDKQFILLASFVSIIVAAVSMATSQFLSEEAVLELDKTKSKLSQLLSSSGIIFFSYILAGLIPIFPIIFFPPPYSFIGCILFAFTGFFILGYFKGKYVKIEATKSAFEMLIVGGIATIIGAIVGFIFKVS